MSREGPGLLGGIQRGTLVSSAQPRWEERGDWAELLQTAAGSLDA